MRRMRLLVSFAILTAKAIAGDSGELHFSIEAEAPIQLKGLPTPLTLHFANDSSRAQEINLGGSGKENLEFAILANEKPMMVKKY